MIKWLQKIAIKSPHKARLQCPIQQGHTPHILSFFLLIFEKKAYLFSSNGRQLAFLIHVTRTDCGFPRR